MLKFAVFEQPGRPRVWRVEQAFLFASPGETLIQADIRHEHGMILCEKPGDEPAGLAIQMSVDLPPRTGQTKGVSLGNLMLKTCLLPDRAEPYLLGLELARHRLMFVFNKMEQWSLFDLAADHPAIKQFEHAQATFTRALVEQRHHPETGSGEDWTGAFNPEADRLALECLALALEAGELLTQVHAGRQLQGRYTGKLFAEASERSAASAALERALPDGLAKSPESTGIVIRGLPAMGVTAAAMPMTEALAQGAQQACDFLHVPMRWIDMEPVEGKYDVTRTDKWIEWAVRTAKIPVHAGPLIDLRRGSVPDWLLIWEHDYDTLRELVYEHVKTLVTRYRRAVPRWTVVSGLHVNDHFALTLERIMDLTRTACLTVKKLQPTAKIQIEITQPWGEYFAFNKRSMPPYMYADMVSQAGIVVDAYTLRLQMGQPTPGRVTRDLMAFSDLLDRYSELDKPIVVSALGAPSQALAPPPNAAENKSGVVTEAGHWRKPWSPDLQAQWLVQATAIALSKPFVQSVCWQDLFDSPLGDMPEGGLMTSQGLFKPAFKAWTDVRGGLSRKTLKPPPLPV
jgi:Glycosyl hydrolase family 10